MELRTTPYLEYKNIAKMAISYETYFCEARRKKTTWPPNAKHSKIVNSKNTTNNTSENTESCSIDYWVGRNRKGKCNMLGRNETLETGKNTSEAMYTDAEMNQIHTTTLGGME